MHFPFSFRFINKLFKIYIIINLLIMNNTRLIQNSVNTFIMSITFKFHGHILICLKVIHLDQKRKMEKRGGGLTKRKKCYLTFGVLGCLTVIYSNTVFALISFLKSFIFSHSLRKNIFYFLTNYLFSQNDVKFSKSFYIKYCDKIS